MAGFVPRPNFGIQADPKDFTNYIQAEKARLTQRYLNEMKIIQEHLISLGGLGFDGWGYPPGILGYGYPRMGYPKSRRGYRRKSKKRRQSRGYSYSSPPRPRFSSSKDATPEQKYIRARVPTARSRRCRDSKGAFIRCR